MTSMTATEVLLRRDRLIVGAGLAVICLLCWLYIIAGAGTGISTAAMTTWQFPPPTLMSNAAAPWGPSYWIVMALMWWVMMIAMMVPSAAPIILLARIQPRGNLSAMVARTGWSDARHDDVEHEQRAVRIISDGRRHLSAVATERRLSETLPFTR
jgi:predicted metal-binding membrane protein